MGNGFFKNRFTAKVCCRSFVTLRLIYFTLPFPPQNELSKLDYSKIRKGSTNIPAGFLLARDQSKGRSKSTFHVILSEGDPHNYDIKGTCGTNGFVENPGGAIPNSDFCADACTVSGVAGPGSGDDCEECNCAIMVANEINAQENFFTYTVTISADSQGTDLAFMSAKSTMEVCLFYIFYF